MMNGNGYRPFKITFLDINFHAWILIIFRKKIHENDAAVCVAYGVV